MEILFPLRLLHSQCKQLNFFILKFLSISLLLLQMKHRLLAYKFFNKKILYSKKSCWLCFRYSTVIFVSILMCCGHVSARARWREKYDGIDWDRWEPPVTQAASAPGGALERLLKRLKERMLSSEIKELEGAEEYENPNHDATGQCQLDLQTDIPINHQPIFVNKNYQLVIPDLNNISAHGILSLAKDQELTLACPGHGNSLTEFSTSVVKGNCRDNGQIEASGETLSEGNLSCKKAPQSYIQMTNNRCGKPGEPNSVFFNVGFLIDDRHMAKLFTVCHNHKMAHTYYAQHKVFHSIQGSQIQGARPTFKIGVRTMYKGIAPAKAYFVKHQAKVLEHLLGTREEAELYINKEHYLNRGHLAPDGDFMFSSWQWATYYYANAAPQYQTINAGNWLRLEKSIRFLAKHLLKNLDVITGSHGILKIHDKPLYLDEENQAIPVPAEFFKIIIEPSTSAGIAVVCSNNPFLKNQPKDKLCEEDICKANKWPVMRSYTHGYCYCCDPMALDKDKLPFLTIPRVEQILQYAPFELKKKSHHQTNHHIDHPSHHYKPHHSHHYKHHHSHYSSNHHRTHHKYQPIPDWDDQLTASMVGT